MKKTTALKLMGVLIICLGGRLMEPEEKESYGLDLIGWSNFNEPMDYTFTEKSIRNLIITTDDKDIVIPFQDIVDALRDEKK